MQPKLIKTELAQYEDSTWDGVNRSGLRVIGDLVLVLPDKAAEKTKGGIMLPQDLKDRQSGAAETGIVVFVGPGAFIWTSDRTRPWEGEKPTAGQRVYFTRYSGQIVIGKDGETYRMMSDTCIGGIEDA